ncbi:phosphatidylinositol-glycan biosynthesis class W protein [Brachionichthys hirsutus]|uniref:phosphatidylinositol-glycan biosynthesis class W protein n=1 Tax=Brachionichthys hirsutus TaxID=412623 RepID=UPI0036043493
MSQRELKEAFVRDLNGTSLLEVALGSFLSPLCLIARGLVLILYYQANKTHLPPLPVICHLLLDFSLLILPLVLSCTLLSSHLHEVAAIATIVLACLLWYIYRFSSRPSSRRPANAASAFLQSRVRLHRVPFVTLFRVFVNVKTAISILAVDFSVFPRRYAKTETYGTGVMDYGVGAFVFANALVCREARRKNTSGSKMKRVAQQILSVWPLFAVGMGRLLSVKMTGYHEHVTEYGVHWNFFFTLAIVRVATSVIFTVLPASQSWIFALLISGIYQFTLDTSGLKEFIIHNDDRGKDFLHANKEGIFSLVGYVAIYMAGVQVGVYVMQPRSQVRQWLRALFNLLLGCFVLYAALCICETLVEPVSRRLANLPFCMWSVAQSLFLMSTLGLADMLLLFSQRTSGCRVVPSSWTVCDKQTDSVSGEKPVEIERYCFIQAVSRNQLLYFLLANVLTGLTNFLMDTIHCSSLISVCVLLLYMFANCTVMYVLHLRGITVKLW